MAEPEEAKGTKHKPVEAVDTAKPIFLVFWQTETRNAMEIVNGDDAEKRANERAADLARSTKRRVLVIGPQRSAFQPPAEIQMDTFNF